MKARGFETAKSLSSCVELVRYVKSLVVDVYVCRRLSFITSSHEYSCIRHQEKGFVDSSDL